MAPAHVLGGRLRQAKTRPNDLDSWLAERSAERVIQDWQSHAGQLQAAANNHQYQKEKQQCAHGPKGSGPLQLARRPSPVARDATCH
jgi:hypothetical protein